MKRFLAAALCSAVAAFCQTEIDTAESELERLMAVSVKSVYAASRKAQKSTEAPASVTVVTRDEIRRYGYRSLADILRTVPGFHVTYDRFYSYVGVRGFGRSGDFNAKILVLLNGHRLNENVYDGAYPETSFPIDVDLLERVEIIRGPGSSLYGTNAFFGVVNMVTVKGRAWNGSEVALEGGSLETVRARGTYGTGFGKDGSLLVSATGSASAGMRRLDYPELEGSLLNGDRERADSAFVSLQKGGLSVEGLASSRRKHFPGLYLGQAWRDSRNYGTDVRGYVDIHHELPLSKGRLLESRVYFDRYQFDGFNPYRDEDDGETIISREFANGAWWGGEVLLHQPAGENHRMTFGMDFRMNTHVRLMTYDSDPYFLYEDARPVTSNGALFVQDDFRLSRRLRINAGIRYDRYTTFGGAFSPRAGLIYEPAAHTAVKLLYGRSFRAPNSYELFYSTPTYLPNPNLRPERIGNTEVVVERYSGRRYRFAVSAFDARISDFINQVQDGDTGKVQYLNIGGYLSRGVEAEAETRRANGLELRASYGYQRVTDRFGGEWLANSPLHIGRLNAAYPLPRLRLTAAAGVQILSRRLTPSRNPEDAAGAYLLPTLTLSTERARRQGVDVAVTIANLANRPYWDPAGDELMIQRVLQNGRTARVKVTFRF